MKISSGVPQLNRLLEGLYIGDNVVWHDDSGRLASVFCLNFIQASRAEEKPIIYVSFDRSPKNLLDKLGPLSDNPRLIVLDCFTHGKGSGTPVFLKFYEDAVQHTCQIIRVEEPDKVDKVMDVLYDTHATLEGDVRFVFDSLTGMQELWGEEVHVLNFYVHSCPRLYELNTIAYWIMEKRAHSPRLRAQINRIAQVAIDLSVKRGTTSLTILKAEKRNLDAQNKPYNYWSKGLRVSFDFEKRTTGPIDLGMRLKALRMLRGFSQRELAKLVGVTSSSISQVESNLIYPSLPALIKMAEVLSAEVSDFFQEKTGLRNRVVFLARDAADIKNQNFSEGSIYIKQLTSADSETSTESYLIEIAPGKKLPFHFFTHKGEEVGYLLSGELQFILGTEEYTMKPGDVVRLTSEMPIWWKNPGTDVARLFWVKVR
ncbi:cupin domain-containing protein [Desulfonema magnum]|nr:cupin domain-containing protein [Desulfonema magnum]